MPNFKKRNIHEQHYYEEKKRKIAEIDDPDVQKKIDDYLVKHNGLPPKGCTRESGFSSFVFVGDKIDINPSMVKKKKIKEGSTAFVISRLTMSPKLPVSCLASTEHVISMQNEVKDFQSEYSPATKKQVMYQILMKCTAKGYRVASEKKLLSKLICEDDELLSEENLSVAFDRDKGLFIVEASTQIADIQQIIRNINGKNRYQIINCNFADIAVNEGICLLNKDASNPIHALVNVANGLDVNGIENKFFVERDAGLTSGKYTSSYQDNNWTFNFFQTLPELQSRTGYKNDSYAVKIYKK